MSEEDTDYKNKWSYRLIMWCLPLIKYLQKNPVGRCLFGWYLWCSMIVSARDEKKRLMLMPFYSLVVFENGRKMKAYKLAEEMLSLAPKYVDGDTDSHAIHYGNLLLGIRSLDSGDIVEANKRLISSGKVSGSFRLDTIGPEFGLASGLYKKGETKSVLKYLKRCRTFWKSGRPLLDYWIQLINAGVEIDFSADLKRYRRE